MKSLEVQALQKEVKRLRKALRFYADPDTYFAILFRSDPPCGQFMDDFEMILDEYGNAATMRPGKLARQTLKGKK